MSLCVCTFLLFPQRQNSILKYVRVCNSVFSPQPLKPLKHPTVLNYPLNTSFSVDRFVQLLVFLREVLLHSGSCRDLAVMKAENEWPRGAHGQACHPLQGSGSIRVEWVERSDESEFGEGALLWSCLLDIAHWTHSWPHYSCACLTRLPRQHFSMKWRGAHEAPPSLGDYLQSGVVKRKAAPFLSTLNTFETKDMSMEPVLGDLLYSLSYEVLRD